MPRKFQHRPALAHPCWSRVPTQHTRRDRGRVRVREIMERWTGSGTPRPAWHRRRECSRGDKSPREPFSMTTLLLVPGASPQAPRRCRSRTP
jgi:hypothetical protein